jgi:hypothetical protein
MVACASKPAREATAKAAHVKSFGIFIGNIDLWKYFDDINTAVDYAIS